MPETLDFTFFAFAIPAVIFAGISKGGFGSGAAFAATPLLALILEPGAAIGLMLPLLMLMDVTALKPYWRKWDTPSAKVLIMGAVPGVALGTLLYRITNPDVFRALIGIIAIGFVLFQWAKQRGLTRASVRPIDGAQAIFWGGVTGFTSFVSHAGGPPASVVLLSRGLGKTSYQATTVICFWAINLLKFIPYLVVGIFSAETFRADLYLFPFAIIGVWVGVFLHQKISEQAFFALTYLFLLITGSKLLWDALT